MTTRELLYRIIGWTLVALGSMPVVLTVLGYRIDGWIVGVVMLITFGGSIFCIVPAERLRHIREAIARERQLAAQPKA